MNNTSSKGRIFGKPSQHLRYTIAVGITFSFSLFRAVNQQSS